MSLVTVSVSRLNKKFPNIIAKPGEDLNLERNITALVRKYWDNVQDYPTVVSICPVLGLSERTIY